MRWSGGLLSDPHSCVKPAAPSAHRLGPFPGYLPVSVPLTYSPLLRGIPTSETHLLGQHEVISHPWAFHTSASHLQWTSSRGVRWTTPATPDVVGALIHMTNLHVLTYGPKGLEPLLEPAVRSTERYSEGLLLNCPTWESLLGENAFCVCPQLPVPGEPSSSEQMNEGINE